MIAVWVAVGVVLLARSFFHEFGSRSFPTAMKTCEAIAVDEMESQRTLKDCDKLKAKHAAMAWPGGALSNG